MIFAELRFYGEEDYQTVIGVVADVKNKTVMEVTEPMVYQAVTQP